MAEVTQLPAAVQELTRTGLITRWSVCPSHATRTSEFLGPESQDDRTVWAFRCKENDKHLSHRFFAAPDPSAPTSPGSVDKWLSKQREELRQRADKSNRGQ